MEDKAKSLDVKKFTPSFARVIIDRYESEKLTKAKKSGIIIPETVRQEVYAPAKGRLLKAGPACADEIKRAEGKEVYFARYSGDTIDDIEFEGRKVFICQDEDILGVIND